MRLASSTTVDHLAQDIRYALRVLVKSPAFTAITILTVAIGTGANATVFSFLSALLFRPAPGVANPDSLVGIYTSDFSSGPYGDSSFPDYETLARETSAFQSIAAEHGGATGVVRVGDVVERVRISAVTGDYFHLLGLKPALGRLLTPADGEPGSPPVAVLAHSLWRRAFASDPGVLGSNLNVNGRSYTIIGVTPERFDGLDLGRAMDLWTPFESTPSTADRGSRSMSIVARLAPGMTVKMAQDQVTALATRLAEQFPDTNRGTLAAPNDPRPIVVVPHTRLPPEFRKDVTTLGAIIMAAVGLVLLIACANIASLMLSRATARDREMAVRLALGAGRQRIVQQLLTESILLGLAGGGVGLLFSLWTADILPSFFPAEQARMLDTRVDGLVLLFVIGLSLVSSVLFGLAPALQSATPSTAATLRSGANRSSESRTRANLRRVLVSWQIALAVVLLISAALLTQSIGLSLEADPGYGTREAVTASIELQDADFTAEQGLAYYAAAIERIRTIRGIEDASFVLTLPFSRMSRRGFVIDGYHPREGEDREHHVNVVSPRYFDTLQIPLIEGRAFDERDRAGGQPVAIVNDLMAQRYYGGKAVGRRITDSAGVAMQIVGVVKTGRNLTFQDPPVPVVYYPLGQSYQPRMTLVARTRSDAIKFVDQIRRELVIVNRNAAVFRSVTLGAHVSEAIADGKLTAALVGACGGMALLLATIGVYGVIAYSVASRMREIGVRVALGARPHHVIHLVLREGLGVTSVGIIFGLLVAMVATPALKSFLFGISTSDPFTYAAVPSLLALIALLAACPAVRRALRVEPNAVLRQE
jgi:putative ABC transport system permease protein